MPTPSAMFPASSCYSFSGGIMPTRSAMFPASSYLFRGVSMSLIQCHFKFTGDIYFLNLYNEACFY